MKKYILVLAAIVLVGLSSCLKEEAPQPKFDVLAQLGKDTIAIRTFLILNNIDAIKLGETGIYYKIITAGTGLITPVETSLITAKYKGRFLNGTVFNETDSIKELSLNSLILGWRLGIPKIKKGGRIRLILASGYAYEEFGLGKVPPNTNLDFDIELQDVK